MEVLLWNMEGNEKSDHNGLGQNGSQHDNIIWNVIGINKLDWDRKELNGSQREGSTRKNDGRR